MGTRSKNLRLGKSPIGYLKPTQMSVARSKTASTDSAEIDHAESNEASPASKVNGSVVKEHNLYPILSEFLWSELELYSKRIDEKRSRNSRGSGGNKWLYLDLVGMEDLSGD